MRSHLAENDDNLIRSPLTPAQEARAVFHRRAIYEDLHLETRKGLSDAIQRASSDEHAEDSKKDRKNDDRRSEGIWVSSQPKPKNYTKHPASRSPYEDMIPSPGVEFIHGGAPRRGCSSFWGCACDQRHMRLRTRGAFRKAMT